MTMTIETNQQRFPLNLNHMSSYSAHPPHFTNPWISSSQTTSAPQVASKNMYMASQSLQPTSLGLEPLKHEQQPTHQQQHPSPQPQITHQGQQHQHQQPQHQQHHQPPCQQQQQHSQQQHHQHHQHQHQHQHHHGQPSPPTHTQTHHQIHRLGSGSNSSMTAYGPVPAGTSGGGGSPHRSAVPDAVYVGQRDMLSLPQDILSLSRIAPQQPSTSATYDTAYTAPSPIHPAYAASSTPYDQLGYAPAPMRSAFTIPSESDGRRYSQPHTNIQNDDRRSFADAIEASHGILSLSQETPRPLYGNRSRGSGDSYGFPSNSSSVSSTSFNGFYGGGSVDSSVSEYSTTGSDIETVTSRALPIPRPQGFVAAPSQVPPPAQSMMSQFSSKMTSTAQKKHKCKVCDKRFTRPSSLQTHMYSHTGEKPFSCEVEGCGRHFSVVSNLRRHRKVHKDHALSETGSEEHHSE